MVVYPIYTPWKFHMDTHNNLIKDVSKASPFNYGYFWANYELIPKPELFGDLGGIPEN